MRPAPRVHAPPLGRSRRAPGHRAAVAVLRQAAWSSRLSLPAAPALSLLHGLFPLPHPAHPPFQSAWAGTTTLGARAVGPGRRERLKETAPLTRVIATFPERTRSLSTRCFRSGIPALGTLGTLPVLEVLDPSRNLEQSRLSPHPHPPGPSSFPYSPPSVLLTKRNPKQRRRGWQSGYHLP